MIYFPTVQRSSSLPSHISMLGLRDEFPPHICWTSLPAWSSMWFVPACFLHFILLCSLSPCSVLAFCHSLPLPLSQFALPSISFLFSKVCRFYLSTSGPQLMPNLATLLLTPIPFGPLYSNKTFFFFYLSFWKWPQLLLCIRVPVFIPLCFFPRYSPSPELHERLPFWHIWEQDLTCSALGCSAMQDISRFFSHGASLVLVWNIPDVTMSILGLHGKKL